MTSNFLLIDTSEKGRTVLALGRRGGIVARRVFRSRFHLTDSLLERVEAIIQSAGVSLTEVGGVIVVLGPGPFSALRGAVTIANSLAFALHIPAVGLTRDEFENFEDLLQKGRVRMGQGTRVLLPHYGQDPTISSS